MVTIDSRPRHVIPEAAGHASDRFGIPAVALCGHVWQPDLAAGAQAGPECVPCHERLALLVAEGMPAVLVPPPVADQGDDEHPRLLPGHPYDAPPREHTPDVRFEADEPSPAPA